MPARHGASRAPWAARRSRARTSTASAWQNWRTASPWSRRSRPSSVERGGRPAARVPSPIISCGASGALAGLQAALLQQAVDDFPVDQLVQEIVEVVRADVAEVQVVGVLPDIDAEDRRALASGDRI